MSTAENTISSQMASTKTVKDTTMVSERCIKIPKKTTLNFQDETKELRKAKYIVVGHY